jgi:hypothetical protein
VASGCIGKTWIGLLQYNRESEGNRFRVKKKDSLEIEIVEPRVTFERNMSSFRKMEARENHSINEKGESEGKRQ